MQVFQQLFFYKNVNFYSKRTLSNPSVFYEAIQHFFDGFPKSVGRLRCKIFLLSFLNSLRGLYIVDIQ